MKYKKAISKLYGERAGEYEKRLEKNRKHTIIFTLLFTTIIAAVYISFSLGKTELVNGKYIYRNEKDETDKVLRIKAVSSGGYTEKLKLIVESRQYASEELEKLFIPFKEELINQIVPVGETLDGIDTDMKLEDSLPGYPFTITWDSDRPGLLSSAGKINERRLEENPEDNIVNLTAEVSYHDYFREIIIPVSVKPKEKTDEERFWELVNLRIEEMSGESLTEGYQILPEKVEGQTLSYLEEKDLTVVGIIACGIVVAVLLNLRQNENLIKRAALRDEQIKRDYPQFVNKIALYYGAGLAIKNIWQKMCEDYERKKKNNGFHSRALYEEMLRCDKKMRDGVGEEDAYELFAENIGLMEYTTLISILQQAVRTGGTEISHTLRMKRIEAFEEQKKTARILGEKAGTKLLAPMFMMLMVVLIVILVPAFVSF